VDLDLPRVLQQPGGFWDLVVKPGDSLHVPEYQPTVQVLGAVVSPVVVQYQPGRGLDYYIANAGGYTRSADKRRVSVRYANGSARVVSRFLFFTSSPEPGPGSTVYVPERPAGERGTDWAVVLAGVAQALSAVTTMVLVVNQLKP
jgi:protein involved in polysaccharide export with SLBB domain